jgi:hypothetical protein
VNVETKEWPKQWMHTYSPDPPARKLMATSFRERKEVMMAKFTQKGPQ